MTGFGMAWIKFKVAVTSGRSRAGRPRHTQKAREKREGVPFSTPFLASVVPIVLQRLHQLARPRSGTLRNVTD